MDRETFITRFTQELENSPSERLVLATNLKDLDDWDSMTSLMIIAMIDEEYKVVISPAEMNKMLTIQDLYDLISSKKVN